jgi:hypothetical protein
MNLFRPTAEEERFSNLLPESDEKRESSGEDESDRIRRKTKSDAWKKLVYFRATQPEPEGKFYSLGRTARRLTNDNHDSSDGPVVKEFVSLLEEKGFDDTELITLLHQLQQNMLPEERERGGYSFAQYQQLAESYVNRSITTSSMSYNDDKKPDAYMEAYAKAESGFTTFLETLAARLKRHQNILERHPYFTDIDRIIEQVEGLRRISIESKFNTSAKGAYISVELPPTFRDDIPQDLHSFDTKTRNIYEAKSLFFEHLKLTPLIKYLFTLGSFLEYAERAAHADKNIKGVYPTLLGRDDDNGLFLDVEHFAHPAIYQGKDIAQQTYALEKICGRNIVRKLTDDGLLSSHRDTGGGTYWQQGVTSASIEAFVKKHKMEDAAAESLYKLYSETAFMPFADVQLNVRNRILIVTGANSRGKSTYMQAIGYLFYLAATGRKFIAEKAQLTMPDLVFDDFDINGNRQYDIYKGVSTFRSQVKKIVTYLEKATKHSIGLFDELYHGTSSPYLLSLGWATLEAFEERGLRAVVSTHEPLLTRFTEDGGYEGLAGMYHRPPQEKGNGRETAVSNVSMQGAYKLKHEPVTDSDAFWVARDEKMPETIMRRADEVLKHITASPSRKKIKEA